MASPFTSSTPAMYDYVGGVKQLQQYSDSDPYLEAFMTMQNRLSALNEQMMKNQIASSTAETARLRQEEEQGQRAYTAGLQTAGVQSGASRYLPEYQAGLVEDARRTYVDRFQKINDAEKLAIAKAQQAKQEGDVALLKEQLDLLSMLRKEKADALERAQDLEWEKDKFKQQMSLQWAQENRLGKESTKPLSESNIYSYINKKLVSGATFGEEGIPFLDANNYITAEGWNALKIFAQENGISTVDLIKKYKSYFAPKKKWLKGYKLSQNELEALE